MTDEELNNLISQTDLVSLVSKYVSLEKKGKNYMGCCPFHNEKTPSFVVSPDKKMYNCFGCHKGGNALTFIKDIENVETKQAIQMLCEFNGVEFKDSGNAKKENPNAKYYNIMNTAKDFYKAYLNQDKSGLAAIEYLNKRGLDKELIDKFDIGLSPSGGDTIHKVLLKQGFFELDAADMALIDSNQNGYYDIFNGRIMFPIKDEMGKTIAFSARIFNTQDKNQPKYINSRETKIFHKGEVLFNLNLAKAEINKKHRVILHEGQMDVIASYRAGLGEAVCSLGTALSMNQVNVLKKYTDNVIICYDGDSAGINASLKAIDVFKRGGFKVHLVLLPIKMDPDEYISKYGASEYVKYFESHIIDDVEYQYQVLLMDKNFADKDVLEKVRIDAFKLISSLKSNILEEKYIARLAENLNVSVDAVLQDYNRYLQNHARSMDVEIVNPYDYPIEDVAPKYEKKNKLYTNLAEIQIFLHAKNKFTANMIDNRIMDSLGALNPKVQELWMCLVDDYYKNYDEFDEGKFIRSLGEEQAKVYMDIMEELAKLNCNNIDSDDLEKCIKAINKRGQKLRNLNLLKEVKSTSDENEQALKIQKLFKK